MTTKEMTSSTMDTIALKINEKFTSEKLQSCPAIGKLTELYNMLIQEIFNEIDPSQLPINVEMKRSQNGKIMFIDSYPLADVLYVILYTGNTKNPAKAVVKSGRELMSDEYRSDHIERSNLVKSMKLNTQHFKSNTTCDLSLNVKRFF
tara:strand:- start:484 stop:927 length:444 start_codon:yes stop_codon:yes gene_type:complete